jgi:hypothetical protein
MSVPVRNTGWPRSLLLVPPRLPVSRRRTPALGERDQLTGAPSQVPSSPIRREVGGREGLHLVERRAE